MPATRTMRPPSGDLREPTFWTEFRAGLGMTLPVMAAAAPIGALFGALAVQKGLTPAETVLMSLFVFAGSAQFVAVEIWSSPAPWLTLGLTALTINLRHVMMGASLVRHMTRFGPGQTAVAAFFLTDEGWALAERRARQGPLTVPFYVGLVALFYLNWQVWTAVGAILGGLVSDPARYGIDFAFNALFIGLIVGFWQNRATGAVILVSGLVAFLAREGLGGTWYIVLGGLAGMLVAALTFRPDAASEGEPS